MWVARIGYPFCLYMQALIGQKKSQAQRFLADGTRIPVTVIEVSGNLVVQNKTKNKDGYNAVQLGMGKRKKGSKALLGHAKKAHLVSIPRFLKEVRVTEDSATLPEMGTSLMALDVFKAGDIVDVIGVSKGKGFAGGVKRHHFKGGPRTHGQSDRERAPGSIGQTTTPGRVYKGKRMAGRMGVDTVTIRNLTVVEVGDTQILIKGLVPGFTGNVVLIEKKEVARAA